MLRLLLLLWEISTETDGLAIGILILWTVLRLNFSQLRARVELETHRRFFFALVLHDVYREGETYETTARRQVSEAGQTTDYPTAHYRATVYE